MKARIEAKAPLRVSNAGETAIALHEPKFGESRVDSRIIAKHLIVEHQNTFALIKKYMDKFKKLGVSLFKTDLPLKGSAGGHPERYALLNEDQAYFLLTLSRNTWRVVDLKLKLVIAFRDARSCKALHGAYLPGYHDLQDTVAALAQRAKNAGSQTDPCIFHMNFNKLVNKTAGIAAGIRNQLNPLQKLMVSNAQRVLWNAASKAEKAGKDHKAAYREAQGAATAFQSTAAYLMGGDAS